MAEQERLLAPEVVAEQERVLEASEPGAEPAARLKPIDRQQSYWGQIDIESLIPHEHVARAIWELTGRLDLSQFLEENKAVEGQAGRERWDPRLLVSVWVYAYSQRIGSARELERQMEHEPGLRWLSGGQVINYHTLASFRVAYGEAVAGLFGELLAILSQAGLVDLEQVTQDGTKIRAVAGADTFRREATLREQLEQARALVAQLGREEGAEQERTKKAAAERRAARERQAKLEQGLQEMEKIRAGKRSVAKRAAVRVSLTEPEARVMKDSQGGYAPSFNVQVSTDCKQGIVVGVEVSQQAGDQAELEPALERIKQEFGQTPQRVLADGGYISKDNIVAMAERTIELIGPQPQVEERQARNRKNSLEAAGIAAEMGPSAFVVLEEGQAVRCPAGQRLQRSEQSKHWDRYRGRKAVCGACALQARCCPKTGVRTVKISKVLPAVAAYIKQMGTEECRALYRKRGAVAEFPHAWIKEKLGLRKFHVRGLRKVRIEVLWAALTYNLQQWVRLCWRTVAPVAAAA